MLDQPRPSLAGRAALALLLFVGVYVLALGIAGLLLWLPWLDAQNTSINARLDLFCLVGAGIIVWNIVPRPDRFRPPGPSLERAAQPRLFAVLDEVAAQTGQAMPAEVYAIPELNAWVTERGGTLGFGARRVMGLGIPLMQVLTVDEFRAVVAHEFGHYFGGDTALGPWIYRTRAAIERTLVGMSRHSGLVRKPFEWYLKLYVRVTHAISRRQEFVADAVAVRIAGAHNMAEGLRAIEAAGIAYEPFWFTEMVPAITRGYRPPLVDGFARFMASPRVAEAVQATLEREQTSGRDPYATHPALAERLAAIGAGDSASGDRGGEKALTLLEDVAAIEAAMVKGDPGLNFPLRGVGWDEMVDAVWAPVWASAHHDDGMRLKGIRAGELARLEGGLAALAVRMKLAATPAHASEAVQERCAQIVGCALALALRARGCVAAAEPGEPISFTVAGVRVRAFDLFADLGDGRLTAEQWDAVVGTLDIAALDLSAPETAPLPAPA
jgi:heat shock protein HtpX